MIHRLRRVRVPTSLAGHGPGRPAASSSAARARDPEPSVGGSEGRVSPPASPTTPKADLRFSASGPASVDGDGAASASVTARQKMPLGSDRRDDESAVVEDAGPSKAEARVDAFAAALSPTAFWASLDELKARQAERLRRQQAQEEGMKEQKERERRAQRVREDESIRKQVMSVKRVQRPPPTAVHAALAEPNPPDARSLLEYTRSRPKIYLKAVPALVDYAHRTNDTRVMRESLDLLRAEGLQPTTPSYARAKPLWELTEELKEIAGVTPNTMLAKRFPPQPFIGRTTRIVTPETRRSIDVDNADADAEESGSSSSVSPDTVLGHLHYLYLCAQPPSLRTALDTLRKAGGDVEDEQQLLHLHLAYTSAMPVDVLQYFRTMSSAQWSRQTLHLCIQVLLRRHRHNGPELATRDDTDIAAVINDIGDLLVIFQKIFRTPGPESWRHIGEYALETDDEYLAQLAFVGAKTALTQDRERAEWRRAQSQNHGAAIEHDNHTNANQLPFSGPDADADTELSMPPPRVTPRFLHLGRQASRWELLLHNMAEQKGWVTRRTDEWADATDSYGVRMLAKWEWCGREGQRRLKAMEEKAYEVYRRSQRRDRSAKAGKPAWQPGPWIVDEAGAKNSIGSGLQDSAGATPEDDTTYVARSRKTRKGGKGKRGKKSVKQSAE